MRSGKIILMLIVLAAGFWILMNLIKPVAHSTVSQEKDIYYCPMHPQIIRDHPGECPICHMRLVKKIKPSASGEHVDQQGSDNGIAGYAKVQVTDGQRQLMGIKVVRVERKPLIKTIRAAGFVAHDLDLYKAELDYVDAYRAYRLFIRHRQTTDTVREFKKRLVLAEAELQHMGFTEKEFKELQFVNKSQPWIQPKLPFTDEGNPSVSINADVYEQDLGFIAIGQKALIKISAYGETKEGIVRTISDVIDPMSRTARLRIEVPQMSEDLKINMLVDVEIISELNEMTLVPRDAVMDTGIRKIVFVEKEAGTFEPRTVELGLLGDGYYQVKSGLAPAEVVAVEGNFLLDSESRLQANFKNASESSLKQGAAHAHQ